MGQAGGTGCVFECLRDGGGPHSGPVGLWQEEAGLAPPKSGGRCVATLKVERAPRGLLWARLLRPAVGSASGELALTLCHQRRCYPGADPTAGPGRQWGPGRGGGQPSTAQVRPGMSRYKHVRLRQVEGFQRGKLQGPEGGVLGAGRAARLGLDLD